MRFPTFDIPTTIFVLIVGDLALAATILAYRGLAGQERSTRIFLAAKLCQAAAWLLLNLRGLIPDVISVLVGNGFLLSGFSLEALSLGTIAGSDKRQYALYAVFPVCCVVALALWGGKASDRVVSASLMTAGIYLSLAFFMLEKNRSRLRVFIGSAALVFALVMVLRAAAAMRNQSFTLFTVAHVQTATFMTQILFLIIGGAGFFFILKERDDRLLRESEEKYRTVTENVAEAIAILQDGRYVFANRVAGELFGGGGPEVLLGREFGGLFWPEDRDRLKENYRKRVNREPLESKYDVRLIGKDGHPQWVSISASVIDWHGRPAVLALLSDIDERKRQQERIEKLLAEKEMLLREVNHRVKNNLTVAVSLLSIQSNAQGEKPAAEVLRDAQSRLRTMSELYDALNAKGSYAELPLKTYLGSIVDEIVLLYPRDPPVSVELDIDETVLDSGTLSAVGLLVNEVLTNSLKHAFGGIPQPKLSVRARCENDAVSLVCADNGIGLPPDASPESSSGFGLQVISMLARQLRAAMQVNRERGTRWRFEFPLSRSASGSGH